MVLVMNVNEVKKHIHVELFEKSVFPSSRNNMKSIGEIKGHWKEETIRCSIRIMRNHNQTDADIREMLGTKFLLDEKTINQFLEKEKRQKSNIIIGGIGMNIEEVQEKVHHDSAKVWSKENTFQMAEGVVVQSAVVLKKHGRSCTHKSVNETV